MTADPTSIKMEGEIIVKDGTVKISNHQHADNVTESMLV